MLILINILHVAIGGAFGSLLRYLVSLAANRWFGSEFAIGTAMVNISGSLVMGIAFVSLIQTGTTGHRFAPLIMTGFLGGYTTFSSYSLDVWKMIESGRYLVAVTYGIGSAMISVLALFIGILVGRHLFS